MACALQCVHRGAAKISFLARICSTSINTKVTTCIVHTYCVHMHSMIHYILKAFVSEEVISEESKMIHDKFL